VPARWYTPFSLLVFAVLVGVLWIYLSATQEPTPEAWVRAAPGLLRETEPAKVPTPPPATIAPSPPQRARRSENLSRTSRAAPILPDIANRLDEASVRLRTALTDSTPFEVAAAEEDAKNHRYESALRKFDRVLSQSPGNIAALSGKAAALAAAQRFEDAAGIYKQIVRQTPRNAETRYNFGVVLYRQSRFGEAAEQFRELVLIDPGHTKGLYNLASLAQRAGRLTEAREAWEAVTKLQPDTPSAWYNLGLVSMDLDQPLDASHCFAVFTALHPTDPDGHLNYALSLSALDFLSDALHEVGYADSLIPCDREILYRKADLHVQIAEQGGDDADSHRRLALAIGEQLSNGD